MSSAAEPRFVARVPWLVPRRGGTPRGSDGFLHHGDTKDTEKKWVIVDV
jgi:hypothetical protein